MLYEKLNMFMKKLSSTSYAVLGLLARKPWSAYSLNKYMRSSILQTAWPRAESGIYTEPKKLLEHGYVTQRREEVDGRLRTIYEITDSGSLALSDWLKLPATHLAIQHESMLKLLLTNHSERNLLQDRVTEIEKQENAYASYVSLIKEGTSAHGFAIPSQIVNAALGLSYRGEINRAIFRWTKIAHELIDEIPDTEDEDKIAEWAESKYVELAKQYSEENGC
ncbi:MAG: PadR family transcriptional regulator [Gammaproteobacteria bacterium]|nr:PadR family transcriptional regulator [Gammaproteobacteria bacterium]